MFERHHVNSDQIGATVARKLLLTAGELLRTQQQVVVAISGGNTMTGILQCLAAEAAELQRFHTLGQILWIETDAYPPTTIRPETNRQLLMSGFFDEAIARGLVPRDNCLFFDTSAMDMKGFSLAAARYEREVMARIKTHPDIALFGIGGGVYWLREGKDNVDNLDPGHIAAIFPGYIDVWSADHPLYLLLDHAPKPPQLRLTMSPAWFMKCSTLIGVLTGKMRMGTLANMFNDDVSHFDCPAKLLLLAGSHNTKQAHLYTDLVL